MYSIDVIKAMNKKAAKAAQGKRPHMARQLTDQINAD